MEPLVIILVPGILGGLAFALIALVASRRTRQPAIVPPRAHADLPITSMSNIATLRVAGVGGLGLVAMATSVALYLPTVRLAMALGLGLGILTACVLILRARKAGPMPSSGTGTGASTVFHLQGRPQSTEGSADTPNRNQRASRRLSRPLPPSSRTTLVPLPRIASSHVR